MLDENARVALEMAVELVNGQLDKLPPVQQQIEAKRKLKECVMWAKDAMDEDC